MYLHGVRGIESSNRFRNNMYFILLTLFFKSLLIFKNHQENSLFNVNTKFPDSYSILFTVSIL